MRNYSVPKIAPKRLSVKDLLSNRGRNSTLFSTLNAPYSSTGVRKTARRRPGNEAGAEVICVERAAYSMVWPSLTMPGVAKSANTAHEKGVAPVKPRLDPMDVPLLSATPMSIDVSPAAGPDMAVIVPS